MAAHRNINEKYLNTSEMNDSVDLVEVTPVFKQQSKSTIAKQQDANISKAKDTESSQIAQLNEKQLIMDTSSNDIIEIGSPSCKDTADENQPKDIQVGNNFKETFAFIENTKYFDSKSLEREYVGLTALMNRCNLDEKNTKECTL